MIPGRVLASPPQPEHSYRRAHQYLEFLRDLGVLVEGLRKGPTWRQRFGHESTPELFKQLLRLSFGEITEILAMCSLQVKDPVAPPEGLQRTFAATMRLFCMVTQHARSPTPAPPANGAPSWEEPRSLPLGKSDAVLQQNIGVRP